MGGHGNDKAEEDGEDAAAIGELDDRKGCSSIGRDPLNDVGIKRMRGSSYQLGEDGKGIDDVDLWHWELMGIACEG
jgi:hypothetical protein